ncbi:MAG TPA: ornithine cyclodeaminase family protein [Candidatus Angelobacter sp.]|nr:ornithine cyclodeaminase family protein [Candidatus Angelobacter sp.]
MKKAEGTILLARADVAGLLTLDECISAVEEAFRQQGLGQTSPSKVMGMPATGGGFHIKAALFGVSAPYFAAKLNGNFFYNKQRFAMPNIQGLIVFCDATSGYPLAVMDSIEITILRTGAASAVAAKYLARTDSKVATICGCGNQGRIQLRALLRVLPLEHIYAFDSDQNQARGFAKECSQQLGIAVEAVEDLARAVQKSDVCVTCTPAKQYFLRKDCVAPGTFVAAVGADNEDKQELDPQLLASSKVVTDVLEQCAEIGDLHHAIAAGLMTPGDVHAELGEVVAGRKPGRTSAEEITIFDSTGTALQDVAAAAVVYERAAKSGQGARFHF